MKKEVIAARAPKDPVSEIFRTLRTNIQFMGTEKGLKTLLITSTMPEEGKSWVSSNLAVTFAQAGKRVVLIDADMRKGRLFTIFGIAPKPGLSNYLSGVTEDESTDKYSKIINYIQETEVPNLFVIPAGNVPPNPSELIISNKMAVLIEELKRMCDIIIFDGTPSALVTDAVILSRMVDNTIIVTAHKQTKMDDLKKIVKSIENVGGKLGGIVLNKVKLTEKEYSKQYYYGNVSSNMPNKKENFVKKVISEEVQALKPKEDKKDLKSKRLEDYTSED